MAKEFKDYDKIFRNQVHPIIGELKSEGLFTEKYAKDVFDAGWDIKVRIWDQAYVQECVYKMNDSSDWQLLRVSMKGLSTWLKLLVLHRYYFNTAGGTIIWCRVDNYLGALRRGGQLDKDYMVVK